MNYDKIHYFSLPWSRSREPEPEPKLQYTGSGSSQKFRLRPAPAPQPCGTPYIREGIHFFISEKTGEDDENDLNLQLPVCKKEDKT
jgi:hypothetical protein